MAATPLSQSPSPCPLPVQNADGSIPPPEEGDKPLKTRVILVGIGTLHRYVYLWPPTTRLSPALQPQETLPVVMGWQDWDTPPTAIDWPRFRAFLHTVKTTASIPADHSSHDHLNEQKKVDVEDAVAQRWQQYFEEAEARAEAEGARIVWGLVDGFLLYWDPEVIAAFDAKFFLRVPYETLVERREARQGYYTAGRLAASYDQHASAHCDSVSLLCACTLSCYAARMVYLGEQFNKEGALWRDPPNYFEKLVYPAYVKAHKHLFENDDIDHGVSNLPGLEVIDALDLPMNDIVDRCCGHLKDTLAVAAP
ncbi:hypothetical protein EWM64_g1665 [Hericium alpestre]|uniref:Uncharacterized protein n=1 Tax=Hericium alpestre TaxID=135208 RepID=A0A4Z0A7N1_9AGAM|nr:hypothetical protein EWM64_g1665 [Hericium alpestre]